MATLSLSPLLLDAPLSNVENPNISTSWSLHLFGSVLELTGRQIGWILRPKSIAGSVVVKKPKCIYNANKRKWCKHQDLNWILLGPNFLQMNPLNPLRFYFSPEKMRQTKCLLFNFWMMKLTKTTILPNAIFLVEL